MRLWVALLLSLTALGGCASDTPSPQEGLVPDDVVATGDLGAISGVVVSESIVPLQGATVTVQGGDNVVTGADGRFVFEDLEPGFYFLDVRAPTYLPIQSTVDVAAGQVAKPRVVLPFDPTPQPYHVTQTFEGFVDASVGIVNWAYDLTVGEAAGVQTCTCAFDFQTDAKAHTFVLEAVWEDSIDPGPYGPTQYYMELESANGLETDYVSTPARMLVSGESFDAADRDFQVRLYPDDVWPTSGQHYQLFVTVWYLDGPPADWSFIAGS